MPTEKDQKPEGEFTLEGLLKGVTTVLDVVAEMIDTAGGLRNNGTYSHPAPSTPSSYSSSESQLIAGREPLLDLFDEEQEIVLVIEIPGVTADEVRIEVQDDILSLETTGDCHYSKDILLPSSVHTDTLRWKYRNGILDVRLTKLGPAGA